MIVVFLIKNELHCFLVITVHNQIKMFQKEQVKLNPTISKQIKPSRKKIQPNKSKLKQIKPNKTKLKQIKPNKTKLKQIKQNKTTLNQIKPKKTKLK